MTGDLSAAGLAAAMPGRPVRAYPALLSTEADAMAWARAGGPSGAVVVADYQAAARGRGGLPWQTAPGEGLSFSVVVRPSLPSEREGWGYVAVSLALAETLDGADVVTQWPDTVLLAGSHQRLASLGIHVQLGATGVDWVVVSVLIEEAQQPRGALLARCVAAIEARLADPQDAVLTAYRARCTTLGRRVRLRLIPMSPDGVQVVGEGIDVRGDGALVVQTAPGRRAAVRPQDLGLIDDMGSGNP